MSATLHQRVARGPFGRLAATLCFGGYTLLGRLAPPLVRHYLKQRLARGREDPQRLAERFGKTNKARPSGALLWIHAASVGEAQSTLPLIERLRREWPGFAILVTSGTVTSARFLAERLPEEVVHQYVPVDLPAAVTGFLDHWQPDVGLFIESEFWPNLIRMSARRGVELVLLNGRISPRSYRRWRHAPALIADLLSCFSLILARSPEDHDRLQGLQAGNVAFCGDLKAAAAPLSADAASLQTLRTAIGQRPLWLAASTHAGEEKLIGEVHRALAAVHPGLLTLLVPRHPSRGRELGDLLTGMQISVAQRSLEEPINDDTDVYLADTIGEMGLWYHLAEIVFLGGSLVPSGGHNLLEPAKLKSALLTGPNTTNFSDMAEAMSSAGALRRVLSGTELQDAVSTLLSNAGERRALAGAAEAYARSQTGVLDRIVDALRPALERAGERQ